MYFETWEELEAFCPIKNNMWNKEKLHEYLIQSCNKRFTEKIDNFFDKYTNDEVLAELLFDFLLNRNGYYNGSDSQTGAARYIARFDKELLKKKKDLLLQAQKNEVFWKRPFQDDEYLEWL